MSTTVKSEVETIAKKLTSKSTYEDVMYALYVAEGGARRSAARQGQTVSSAEGQT